MSVIPSWFPEELHHAGRENLDVEHVARYDNKMDADAAAEVVLLERWGLDPEWGIVEYGPGTGQFTVEVAPRCARVVAVDVSPPMVAQLEAKLDRFGLVNVEVVTAGFLSYAHTGRPADLVYSRFALHHLPDLWKVIALSRIREHMMVGGIFRLWDVVYDFPLDEAVDRIERWCASGGDEVEGAWSRAEIEEHVRDEHSTFSWMLDEMIERAGFEIADVVRTGNGFESKYLLRAV